ncbi:MAG: triose-phosphate isomerase [Bacteroidales bacterium]|nr:triose-phosphate isomerase [Bacteroidales bacterium]
MRKKIVAGNWKMNNTLSQSISLVENIIKLLKEKPIMQSELCVVIAPPFISLEKVGNMINGHKEVFLSAQNCHSEIKGAYTGEVSVPMLKEIGCNYVIIGHSERRAYFNENDETLAKKTNALLKEDLIPIFCCGELLIERQAGNQEKIVKSQLNNALFHLSKEQIKKVVIAYEPVWAIGTGVTATSAQAQEMHAFIRKVIAEKYGTDCAEEITILYGGSCNAKNAQELFANADVDGGLIGGASLIAEDFINIIHANK